MTARPVVGVVMPETVVRREVRVLAWRMRETPFKTKTNRLLQLNKASADISFHFGNFGDPFVLFLDGAANHGARLNTG